MTNHIEGHWNDKSDSSDSLHDDVSDVARALSELTEIALDEGPDSGRVGDFIAAHRHLGQEFKDLAEECLLHFGRTVRVDHRRQFSATLRRGIALQFGIARAIAACALIAVLSGMFAVAYWAVQVRGSLLEREQRIIALEGTIAEQDRIRVSQDQEGLADFNAERAKSEVRLKELNLRIGSLTEELKVVSNQRDSWRAKVDELEAHEGQNMAEFTAMKVKYRELLSQVASSQKRDDQRLALMKKCDASGRSLIAAHVLSMIDDADILRLVLRQGVRSESVELVRKLTKDALERSKKLTEDLFNKAPTAADTLPPGYQTMLTNFTKEIVHYAESIGKLDPMTAPPDVTLAAALLDYASKKQLYALEFRRAVPWIRDESTRELFSSYAAALEASAQELRASVSQSEAFHSDDGIKVRDVMVNQLIKSYVDEIGRGSEKLYGYPK